MHVLYATALLMLTFMGMMRIDNIEAQLNAAFQAGAIKYEELREGFAAVKLFDTFIGWAMVASVAYFVGAVIYYVLYLLALPLFR